MRDLNQKNSFTKANNPGRQEFEKTRFDAQLRTTTVSQRCRFWLSVAVPDCLFLSARKDRNGKIRFI